MAENFHVLSLRDSSNKRCAHVLKTKDVQNTSQTAENFEKGPQFGKIFSLELSSCKRQKLEKS